MRAVAAGGRQFAYEADPLDRSPFDARDLASGVENLEGVISADQWLRGIARTPVAGEAAYDDGFGQGPHARGLSHSECGFL